MSSATSGVSAGAIRAYISLSRWLEMNTGGRRQQKRVHAEPILTKQGLRCHVTVPEFY